ncbi:hypothetical protein HJG60_010475 [Phyllostomus discolor]|uniref:Uncharacterized protein n=1 Tax=Phyllostomus discolor TaxID=89673 RepID=A0A834ARC4_9CHIR|nr:hypothetical protein HJG60_010475 [Phyllostomus discolor]
MPGFQARSLVGGRRASERQPHIDVLSLSPSLPLSLKINNLLKNYLIALKNRMPRNKFIKGVKGLHSESYKTLKNETEEYINKWKHIPCSWEGRINIIKMSILPKAIHRFSAISVKIPMAYFTELKQIFQNFI